MINSVRDEKDKEWIRRRQMRLVQVRKQSNDIAKQLRVRVNNEEQERKIKKENEVEVKFELWKIKQLKDLEEMYRNAVNDIGIAHKLAIQEPENNVITEEKQKIYLCKAKERGETAMEHALREKREAIEKKLIPIQRKIITRQIEDIRSSLVRSIPPHKQSVQRNISVKKTFNPKLFESSYEDEKQVPSCKKVSYQEDGNGKKTGISSSEDHIRNGQCTIAKQKSGSKTTKKSKKQTDLSSKTKPKTDLNSTKSSNMSCPERERFWINLGAIEAVTEVEEDEPETAGTKETEEVQEIRKGSGRECQKKKESEGKIIKNGGSKKKSLSEKEGKFECYGYSVHDRCKLNSDVSSVTRVVNQAEPDPVELARQEEEQLEREKKEKEDKIMMAVERGYKAIEKEKINRNYNELLAKLEKLSTKEKLIKTYCHIPPPHMFMSDERRQEKSIRKQRIMDSEFEKIYYETMGKNPGGRESEDNHKNVSDPEEVEYDVKTSISSGDYKQEEKHRTSPVEKVSIKKTPSSLHFKRTKISKGGEIFLSDIDRLLRKTRKLRQDSHRSSEHPPSECKLVAALSDRHLEKADDKENVQAEEVSSSELGKSVSLSPCEDSRISDVLISTKKAEMKGSLMDMGMGDLGRDFPGIRTNTIAWPVHQVTPDPKDDITCARSSTTSYRDLPSQILPKRINSLLKLLVQLKEREGKSLVADELIVKMEETLDSLIKEAERSNVTLDNDDCHEFQFNPQLNYYITKLLTMSRERIANLSVSSESDLSTQKMEEGGSCGSGKPKPPPENKYLKQMNKSSKCSNLKRAKELERVVKKWKRILEESLKKCPPSGENCEESSSQPEDARCFPDEMTNQSSSFFEKYEEVSKKCSACISGLSSVLAGFRKEMARGGEYSGDENLGCGGSGGGPQRGHQCQGVSKQECPRSRSMMKPEVQGSCERSCPRRPKMTDDNCRQGSESRQSADESLDSLPNVMEVLLNKGLISSPFRWDTPENEGSHCSGCCEFSQNDKPKPVLFVCRPTCRGACNPKTAGDDTYDAPLDPEALRALRKKLEKIPMKYVDPGYGVYSPTPVPRPIGIMPKDPEFVKKNFGQPLFGLPIPELDPDAKRPRQLYFRVAGDERPSSEPRICDKNDMSGSESDRQSSAGGSQKRPRSTPPSRRQDNTDDTLINDATYVKDGRQVSDGACFASGLDRRPVDDGTRTREEISQNRWSSANYYTATNFSEDGGPPRSEQNTSVRGLRGSCAGSCAVHCSGQSRESAACGCQPSGRERIAGTRSPNRMNGSSAHLDGYHSPGRRSQGECPHQGTEDEYGTPEGGLSLDWAEDFLGGLP